MFNRKNDSAESGAKFEPDLTGSFVATLDALVYDRHGVPGRGSGGPGGRAMLHRLIGRERQQDGSERLVVAPFNGCPRQIHPDEPHRIVSADEERGFDYAVWCSDERQAERDRLAVARLHEQREALRDRLRHALAINAVRADSMSSADQDAQRNTADLLAEGCARRLGDGVVVLATPVDVQLDRWPYLGRTGTGTFTPATGSGQRLLVHGAPSRRDGLVRPSGRYPVVGTVTAHDDGTVWTAYGAPAELVGPGVAGVWDEQAVVDVREWVNARRTEDERAQERQRVAETVEWMRQALLTRYAVYPRNDTERAACRELAAEGLCYELDDSFMLLRSV